MPRFRPRMLEELAKWRPISYFIRGGVLYSKNARRMNQERLELEKAREKERDDAWQKRYDTACKKVFKQTKVHRVTWQSPRKWEVRIWKQVIKEFMNNVYICVD